MLKLRSLALALAAAVLGAAPALATTFSAPNYAFHQPDYSSYTGTPFADPHFFPITVWWQQPQSTNCNGFENCAAAAASAHINIFHAVGDGTLDYPETCTANAASDDGEYAAAAVHGVYVLTGIGPNFSANGMGVPRSIACHEAAIAASGQPARFWLGVNAGDEPNCTGNVGIATGPDIAQTPAAVAYLQSVMPAGKIVLQNMTLWEDGPLAWISGGCGSSYPAAMQAPFAASFDKYPLANASMGATSSTDYNTVGNDTLWEQGIGVAAEAAFARPGQPIWTFVDSGADNQGGSMQSNTMSASISGTTMTATGTQRFGSNWASLKVTGDGVTNAVINSITDSTHAVLSASGSGSGTVTITGGADNSDCVAAANICVVNGNEYRYTPSQVAAEVWMSIINGANGISYFCHDLSSGAGDFCLGDSTKGGAAATAALANITWVNQQILQFATVLNAPTVAQCSMYSSDASNGTQSYYTATSCTSNRLTLSTGTSTVQASAIVKEYNGQYYVIVQPSKRAATNAGVTLTISFNGAIAATVAFDTDAQYDAGHSTLGASPTITGGTWSDTFGANGDDYQTRIYRVSGSY